MRWQQRLWRIQGVGWIVLTVLLIAAAAGAFSEGPLSWTTVQAETGGLSVEHQRFYRNGASSSLEAHLPDARGAQEIDLLLSTSLLRDLSFETIRPQPLRAQATEEGLRLTFAAPDEGKATIYFAIRPNGVGRVAGRIALFGAPAAVPVRFFIYP